MTTSIAQHPTTTARRTQRTSVHPTQLICVPAELGDLARFAPISLAEMDAVALLNRTDRKYVFAAGLLDTILPALADEYRVLEIAGVRTHRYHTRYFDTAEFALYRRHHAGGRNRYKVRLRTYLDSQQSFVEVKHKVSADRTIKHRLATAPTLSTLTPELGRFVAAMAPIDPSALRPVLSNDFTRITLVSLAAQERVTLDLGLQFGSGGQIVALPGIVVAEVKQAGINRGSPFMRAIRRLGQHETGLSKYCTGAALLYADLPQNNLKSTLLHIRSIQEDYR